MPNTFKVKTKKNIGTADSAVYTCPGATATTIIGMNLANTTTMTFMRYRHNNNGDGLQASQQSGTQTFYFGATYITD